MALKGIGASQILGDRTQPSPLPFASLKGTFNATLTLSQDDRTEATGWACFHTKDGQKTGRDYLAENSVVTTLVVHVDGND